MAAFQLIVASVLSAYASGLVLNSGQSIDLNPPRMLVAEGCDGSTAMLQHAAMILSMHGVDTGTFDSQKELLDKKRNPFISPDQQDIVVAMQSLQKQRRNWNQTLLFKSILHRDLDATLDPRLVQMGTLAAYSTRKNKLDQLICMIRDCFLDTDAQTTTWGYPVDGQGQPSRLCFERRNTSEKVERARIKVFNDNWSRNFLRENLEFFEQQEATGQDLLKKAGYKFTKVAYEDLVAFQKNLAGVETSIQAWTYLLNSWNVPAKREKLISYFAGQQGTWDSPSMRDTIHNFDEVSAELHKLGKQDMLRE